MKEPFKSVIFEIPGCPIPWQRPGHYGKKCYDRQKKDKEVMQWHLKMNFTLLQPCSIAIRLVVDYHMIIPKSYSRRRALECVGKPHVYKPDLSNLVKFTEDTFNGILWKDDSIISEILARKFYSYEPKTVFKMEPMILNLPEKDISEMKGKCDDLY